MSGNLDALLPFWAEAIGTGPTNARSVEQLAWLAKQVTCVYADDAGEYAAGYRAIPTFPAFTYALQSINRDLDVKRITAWLTRHRGASAGRYRLCETRIGKARQYWVERKEAADEAAMLSKPYCVAGPALDR